MNDRLLSVEETAAVLDTTVDRVYALNKAGKLKFMKLGRLKCRQKTLEAFMEEYDGYDLNDLSNIKELTV